MNVMSPADRAGGCGPATGEQKTVSERAGVDRGAASVYALAVGLALVLAGSVIAVEGRRLVDRERARVAADFGALAGARHASAGSGPACAQARRLVERNGAALVGCVLDGLDLIVTAELAGPGGRTARATSRAGPVRATD
jgi:secretion/DNA translocation related TadE-like protein